MPAQTLERFAAVGRDGRPKWITVDSGCWEWQLSRNEKGYGQTRFRGRSMSAHRAVWIDTNGEIPDGGILHHTCRNRACVNPEHLEVMTPSGHSRMHRRLTPEDVREIRRRHRPGVNSRIRTNAHEIAAEFGVTTSQITHIICGRDYAWVK